jgi:hypothetical protein
VGRGRGSLGGEGSQSPSPSFLLNINVKRRVTMQNDGFFKELVNFILLFGGLALLGFLIGRF